MMISTIRCSLIDLAGKELPNFVFLQKSEPEYCNFTSCIPLVHHVLCCREMSAIFIRGFGFEDLH